MVKKTRSWRHARIEYLKVENFRALRKVEFRGLTPMTVLLGPNGSRKSTVFDVFAVPAECYSRGLPEDWRVVVVVDRDDDRCLELKQVLESRAAAAGSFQVLRSALME